MSVSKRTWVHKGVTKTAYIHRYIDGDGKHCQKTFKLKRDADAFARVTDDSVRNGTHITASRSLTVEQVCDLYLKYQEDRVRAGVVQPSRYRNIKRAIDVSFIPLIGGKRLKDLKPVDIEELFRLMMRTGTLAPYTARARITEFRQLLDFGIRRGFATENVVAAGMRDVRRVEKQPIRTFKTTDVVKLLTAVDRRRPWEHNHNWGVRRCLVNVAAFCGLRYGEIMALTADSLDLAGRIIKVRHSLTDGDVIKAPKTRAGIRDVPMPPHVAEMLRSWLNTPKAVVENRGLIFRAIDGKQISAVAFHAGWRNLLRDSGLFIGDGDELHFHALRHFAASNMIESGLSLPDVAQLLGHSKFDMTLQVYAHTIVGGARHAQMIDAMSERLAEQVAQSATICPQPLEKPRSKNMVTVLCEERLALCVYRPQALIKGLFVTS